MAAGKLLQQAFQRRPDHPGGEDNNSGFLPGLELASLLPLPDLFEWLSERCGAAAAEFEKAAAQLEADPVRDIQELARQKDTDARTSTANGAIIGGSPDQRSSAQHINQLSTVECAVLVHAVSNTDVMEQLRSDCLDLLAQHSPGICSRYELLRDKRNKAGDALLAAIRKACAAADLKLPAGQKVWVGAQTLYQAFRWLAQTAAGHKGGECMKYRAPFWVASLNSVAVWAQAGDN